MKFATYDGGRIGLIDGDDIVELSDGEAGAWPPVGMVRFIAGYGVGADIALKAKTARRTPLASVKIECPLTWPNKLIAFPANYDAHIEEMKTGSGLISKHKASGQGFFLKANSSLSGPYDPIVLPDLPGREIHHECELAIIIGKGGREIPPERALEHIFGYSCLIDVVIRGTEERVMRKSFDSFCPLGPYIVTADEIADVADIDLELSVNGIVKQKANTRDLIVDVPEMIAMASSVMTLHPGDIIASGTPSGVGPIVDGDSVRITISGVGEMVLKVVGSKTGRHDVWNK
jgi:2-keto-4-pentenoate hydratase/2-oxohepta-3-ene-1,7-dioic acid hydratase in catechol pathway